MSIISTANIAKALWPGVNTFWGQGYNEHPLECYQIFDKNTSDKNYEEDVMTVGFGMAPVKPQGGSVSYDTQQQGYTSRYTHVAYGLGYILTEEEIEDNLYRPLAQKRTKNLAFAMRQTKETVHANILNRAFNSSYLGADGVVLCSASHPDGAGGTFSNLLSTAADLSETSLEDMLIQIMQATDARGNKISLMGKSLIVAPGEWFNANRILKSVLQNDTANNAVNVLKATNALPGGIVLNHYLTDADAWFIKTNCPDGLKSFERRAIAFSQDSDFDTNNIKYKAVDRYSAGWTDPRGIFGTPGA